MRPIPHAGDTHTHLHTLTGEAQLGLGRGVITLGDFSHNAFRLRDMVGGGWEVGW